MAQSQGLSERLEAELAEAEAKAWDSLGRYKFQMFGYWAGVWVHLNRLGDVPRPNPFRALVHLARNPPPRIALNQATLTEIDQALELFP